MKWEFCLLAFPRVFFNFGRKIVYLRAKNFGIQRKFVKHDPYNGIYYVGTTVKSLGIKSVFYIPCEKVR